MDTCWCYGRPLAFCVQDIALVLVIGRDPLPCIGLYVFFHAGPAVDQVITVQCGLPDYQPFGILPSPSEFAGVQLTVHEITAAGGCTTIVASTTKSYNASVVIAPQPVLSMVASGTTVCSSETQATVKFDFSTSENMAPLILSQFTVLAKSSTGATAARVFCTPGKPQLHARWLSQIVQLGAPAPHTQAIEWMNMLRTWVSTCPAPPLCTDMALHA